MSLSVLLKRGVAKSSAALISTSLILGSFVSLPVVHAVSSTSSSSSSSLAACTPSDSGLVAYWKLDSDAVDSTIYNNLGTPVNGVSFSSVAPVTLFADTGSATFDGSSDVITVSDTTGLSFGTADDFSVSAWVNAPSFSGYQTIIHKIDDAIGARPGFLFTVLNGVPQVYLINDFNASSYIGVSSNVTIPAASWHQVGFSYDGSGLAAGVKIYVDGVDVTGAAFADTLAGSIVSTASIELGARSVAAAQHFLGNMDEVRMYDRVLSLSDMASLAAGQCIVATSSSSSLSSEAASVPASSSAASVSSPSASSAAASSVASSASSEAFSSEGGSSSVFSSSSSAAAITACIPSGLVGYWPHDNGEGVITDDLTVNENDGVVSGASWATGTPAISGNGSALNFDGTNDVAVVSNDSALELDGTFTVSAWVKSTGDSDYAIIAGQSNVSDLSGYYITINQSTGYPTVYSLQNASYQSATFQTNILADGDWHLLTGTFDGTNLRMYLDGLAGIAVPASAPVSGNDPFRMGASLYPGRFFTGSIDDVRVYDRALSDVEVSNLYADCGGSSSSSMSSSSFSFSFPSEGSSSSFGEGSSSEAPSFTIQGLTGPTSDDQDGGFRGHRTNDFGAAIKKLGQRLGLGGGVAPAGFGGSSRVPLSTAELGYFCSIQRAIPADASSTLINHLAKLMADLMGRNTAFIADQLKNTELCRGITAALLPQAPAPSAPDRVIATNAKGFPVSWNPSWNACFAAFYGNYSLTKADIRNNPEKDKDGTPRDCAYYHEGATSTWYFPDESVYFTFDQNKNTAIFPVGYTVIPDKNVATK